MLKCHVVIEKIFKVDILSTWCDAHILIKPRKGNGFRNSRFKTQSKEFRELSSKGGVKKNADLNSSSLIHPDSDEGWRDLDWHDRACRWS